jgi:hypothetical protein
MGTVGLGYCWRSPSYSFACTLGSPLAPPYSQAQTLQTVLLFCLAVLALSSTPFADTLEAAVTSPSSSPHTPTATLVPRLRLFFEVLVPGTAVLWAFAGERILACCLRASPRLGLKRRTRGERPTTTAPMAPPGCLNT